MKKVKNYLLAIIIVFSIGFLTAIPSVFAIDEVDNVNMSENSLNENQEESLEKKEEKEEDLVDEVKPGEVTGEKEAEVVTGDGEDGRKADITITVDGESFDTSSQSEKEIVLVLDASGSMGKVLDDENTRLSALKKAAEELIDSLLKEENKEMIKVGIVYYATNVDKNSYCNLTTTKSELMKCLNDMVADGGTNVQAGLKKAKDLFSGSETASQTIIVLSDGIPTFYGDEGNEHGAGSSDSYENKYYEDSNEVWNGYGWNRYLVSFTRTYYTDKNKTTIVKVTNFTRDDRGNWVETIVSEDETYKPSYKAKEEANDFKDNGGEIYSVGFAIEEDSDAEKFLKDLASKEENYFLATSLENLKKVFQAIINRIDLIATNVKVEDIIPDKFEIDREYFIKNFGEEIKLSDDSTQYGNRVIVSKVANGNKLTWLIGDLRASDATHSLTFRVKAKGDYYGNMFTNDGAKITGDAVEGHPIYGETNPLEVRLDDPTVPIPAVTDDDNYKVKQGETLTVDFNKGVRKNDYKTIQTDDNAIVVDKVVKVVDVTRGLLTLNEDGSFTYKAPTDYVGDVTFTYYIETTVQVNGKTYVVKSNPSTVTITIEKMKTTYVVRHYEENTTKKVAEDEVKSGYVYGKGIGNARTDLVGWILVGKEVRKEITLDKDVTRNVIIFYYKKVMGKVIVHYVDEDGNQIADDVILEGQANVDRYQTELKNIPNWVFKEVKQGSASEKGTYTEETLEVTYVYKKVMGKVIVHYVDEDGNQIADDVILEGQANVDRYQTELKNIPNWVFKEMGELSAEISGTYIDGTLEVTYVYKKLMGKVIINYVDEKGNVLSPQQILEKQVGEKYKTSSIDIPKYLLYEVLGDEEGLYAEEDTVVTYVYRFVGGTGGNDEIPTINDNNIPNTGVVENNMAEIIFVVSSVLFGASIILKKKFNY